MRSRTRKTVLVKNSSLTIFPRHVSDNQIHRRQMQNIVPLVCLDSETNTCKRGFQITDCSIMFEKKITKFSNLKGMSKISRIPPLIHVHLIEHVYMYIPERFSDSCTLEKCSGRWFPDGSKASVYIGRGLVVGLARCRPTASGRYYT